MKKHIVKILAAAGLAILLAGCAKSNIAPPMSLSQVAPKLIAVQSIWTAQSGGGTNGKYFNLGTVVVDNVVYVDNADGDIYALNFATGQTVWHADVKTTISTTPTVADGKLFVGTLGGELIALNSNTGKQLWKVNLTGVTLNRSAVTDNIVVVHTHNGNVAAYDVNTGKQLWLHNGSTPTITLEGSSSPVISDGLVIVGFSSGQVAAFDLKTGQVVWQRPIALPHGGNVIANMVDIDSTPVVINGTVYAVAYHGDLVALNLQNGRLIWQHPVSAYRNLAYDNGKIFVTDETGEVLAFDQNTGQVVWIQKNLEHRSVSAPAVVSDQYIVVGDYDGYVHFLSIKNGALLARVKVGDKAVRAQPVNVKGQVVVNTTGGRVTVLKPGVL